jgi:uncharacterized protein (DUF302 family)
MAKVAIGRRVIGWLIVVAVFGCPLGTAAAEEIRTYSVNAKFDDVRLELDTAILARGLSVHSNGNIAAMLDRTGADVGSNKAIYIAAEFVTFCSAKYSRMAMEADAANMTLCPFGISVFQTIAKPDEVTVAYRRLSGGVGASGAAFTAINTLIDGIAKDAVK